MRQGRTLQSLAGEVVRQAQSKRDLVADTRVLDLETSYEQDKPTMMLSVNRGTSRDRFGITTNAHRQLAERLKIPKLYYDRMVSEAPELLCANTNHWLHEKPEQRMVRTLDGNFRAFMSSGYRPLDNDDLLAAIMPSVEPLGLTVRSCEITESRLYLHFVTERLRGEAKVGRPVQGGLIISNSEVGRGALRIEQWLYELVCKNGMVAPHALRQHHAGRRTELVEGAAEFYRDETRQADDRAFFMKVADTVKAMCSDEMFEKGLDWLREAVDTEPIQAPTRAVEVVQRKLGLNDGEKESVLMALVRDGDLSKYGLAQAVTQLAHSPDRDYDRCVEVERLGAKVIDLPRTEWESIANAA
jgi:hypothetical protein